ncbi:DUF4397 domain-containing protein [candidate division KSB1 bacterium]|nr:DUF4397 domain-containing protein [candidate division KSB1 bacterium]
MVKKIVGTVFLLLCAVALLTCDGNDLPINPIEDFGHIMVTHASPDLANVDVYFGENFFIGDKSYPNSTAYMLLDEGGHKVSLKPTGTFDAVLETEIDLKDGDYYSVFACGASANLAALVIKDDYPELQGDETLIRFVHLSPDAPAVDVTLADGATLFQRIEFKGHSDFVAQPSGLYDLTIRLAGTEEVLVELKGVALLPNVAHTVWLRGFFHGSDGQALGGQLIYNRIIL